MIDPSGSRIIDISRPVEPESAVWPGDTPFSIEWTMRTSNGESVNLSAFHGSPHIGTHADAPLHVREGAPGIDAVDLRAYLGAARVVEAAPGPDGLLPASALDPFDPSDPPRILLKTGTDPDPRRWTDRFAALSPGLARRLAEGGALLVGLDTPSVDPADSKDLAAHRILLDAGLAWLENLDLSRAEPGIYTLIALPLWIRGADASPVRAILIG